MKFLLSLCVALVLVGATPAQEKPAKGESSAPVRKYQNVDAEKFDQLRRSNKEAVVLDVRTKKEYREGHIPGSVLIDFMSPDFEKQVSQLDKSKTYLVHCAAGGRSSRACKKMEKLDFSKLYNLEGGMGAWEKAGKAVEK